MFIEGLVSNFLVASHVSAVFFRVDDHLLALAAVLLLRVEHLCTVLAHLNSVTVQRIELTQVLRILVVCSGLLGWGDLVLVADLDADGEGAAPRLMWVDFHEVSDDLLVFAEDRLAKRRLWQTHHVVARLRADLNSDTELV